jgi:hypothetical protein
MARGEFLCTFAPEPSCTNGVEARPKASRKKTMAPTQNTGFLNW